MSKGNLRTIQLKTIVKFLGWGDGDLARALDLNKEISAALKFAGEEATTDKDIIKLEIHVLAKIDKIMKDMNDIYAW